MPELKLLNDWLVNNGLFLQKTKCELFGSSPGLSSVTGFSVSVGGYCIKRVREYRYLLVLLWMRQYRGMLMHVKSIVGKIGKRLGMFNRIRKDFTVNTADILHKSFILPIADYYSAVLNCCSKGNTELIEKLQSRAARIIMKSPCSD